MKKIAFIVLLVLLVSIAYSIISQDKLDLDTYILELYQARSEVDTDYLKDVLDKDVYEKIKNDDFILEKLDRIHIISKTKNKIIVVINTYGHDANVESSFYSDELVIEKIEDQWIVTSFNKG